VSEDKGKRWEKSTDSPGDKKLLLKPLESLRLKLDSPLSVLTLTTIFFTTIKEELVTTIFNSTSSPTTETEGSETTIHELKNQRKRIPEKTSVNATTKKGKTILLGT
jgi:hypothetical protein